MRDWIRAFWLGLGAAAGALPAAEGGWKLAWSDEFAGPSVDAAVWGFESGYVRNQEDQYYTNRAENSRIDNGTLLIQARRDGWNGHEYTSASRTTRGRKSWMYGRFEMRARIDARPGSWPAWWWLPDAGGWPRGGEIDMMEAYQGKCLFNVMDGNQKWTSPAKTVSSLGGARWTAEFHTWTMEWDSLRIELFLDGVSMNRYAVAQADGTGPDGSNPFRHPGYMIVNQAIGGTQGGDPSATEFPVELRVDWIRVHAWTAGPSHALAVKGGAGSGTYAEGARASLSAALAPAGQAFDRWAVTAGQASIEDPSAADTRLIMGSGDVTVQAVYKIQPAGILPAFGKRPRTASGAKLLRADPRFPFPFPAYTAKGEALPPAPSARPAAGAGFLPR